MDGLNKKGQVAFVSLMIGIVLFILALALAPPLNQVVTGDDVMGVNGLDCSNASISNQDKAICTETDTIQPLWFFVVAGLGILAIGKVIL